MCPDSLTLQGIKSNLPAFHMKFLKTIFNLYFEGFRNMTVGKTLWAIILLKLFIMFAVFRLFFFHDFLGSRFNTDKEKGDYVIEQLTDKSK